MHAISSYRGNRPTHTHTHPQTGPITIHCAAASAQCKKTVKYAISYSYRLKPLHDPISWAWALIWRHSCLPQSDENENSVVCIWIRHWLSGLTVKLSADDFLRFANFPPQICEPRCATYRLNYGKYRANFTKFLKFVKIRFIAKLVTAKFSNSYNSEQSITLRQPLNGNIGQWWSRTAILTLGKTVKLQAIRRLYNKLLMNDDHAELLTS